MMQGRVGLSMLFKRSGHARITAQLGRWNSTKKEDDMAVKFHKELSQVMAQEKVIKNESRGFLHFLKTNSTQILNIGATFFCVLLSYQIIALRKTGRIRQAELEEAREQLLQKQELLQSLTDEEFVQQMAQECAETVRNSWWGFRGQQRNDLAATMQSIIGRKLGERIGDAGFTEEQKKQIIVDAIRDAVRAVMIGETVEDRVEDIEIKEDASGRKVVQKRVFSI